MGNSQQILITAFLTSLIVAWSLRKRNPWRRFRIFFLVIFFAAWAGGAWIEPAGIIIKEMIWMPVGFISLLTGIMISASLPLQNYFNKKKTDYDEDAIPDNINWSVWLLLIFLILSVLAAYLLRERALQIL
jgi:hypothetical protein